MINNNFIQFMQMMGVMRQNPQQAALNLLQQGVQNGRVSQEQYNTVASGIQNGLNPNQIIQQMMNSGMISQSDYEQARQGAAMFNGGR
jgi:hypothetical protein